MRGKGLFLDVGDSVTGITPAYAGKSDPGKRRTSGSGDHPRVCGEKLRAPCPDCPVGGSPPRMRGKATDTVQALQAAGITPAYAGKSMLYCDSLSEFVDHPRVCGEKDQLKTPAKGEGGSPPRMRGKEAVRLVLSREVRITPAYAGKRERARPSAGGREDHPRVCGEKERLSRCASWAEGSPPRMRGKAVWKDVKRAEGGITPAYAGKRSSYHNVWLMAKDHPRVCGEKAAAGRAVLGPVGSPPRMRGKGLDAGNVRVVAGITPAYAGKSAVWCPDFGQI